MILRDRDANSGWRAAADGTLEERRFFLQNWRADVSALCDTTGRPIERIKYSAYGTPITLTDIDFNSDGNLDPDDTGDFVNTPYDWNLDGSTNGSDTTDFQAAYNAVSGNAYGRGYASLAGHGNRIGYAGYIYDRFISGSDGGKWHVRHRVLDSGLGRWTRRDPLGYVDGPNRVLGLSSLPTVVTDSLGLFCSAPSSSFRPRPGTHSLAAHCTLFSTSAQLSLFLIYDAPPLVDPNQNPLLPPPPQLTPPTNPGIVPSITNPTVPASPTTLPFPLSPPFQVLPLVSPPPPGGMPDPLCPWIDPNPLRFEPERFNPGWSPPMLPPTIPIDEDALPPEYRRPRVYPLDYT